MSAKDGRHANRGTVGRRWAINDTRIAAYIPSDWVDELIRLGRNQSDAIRVAIDIALHPLEHESTVIVLGDPLPCSIRADTESGICEKPAHVAYANRFRNPMTPGHWALQPVCKECALAAAKVYEE